MKSGLKPFWEPIRGGIGGSMLVAMGLPTPNIFTESGYHHGKTEWLSVDALEKLVECIANLVGG